eukprot:CAMPEP_0119291416 /NCGR_PEP_ID=MMETSP1329-20130426/42422_1 /TAXON_ID=114041 /ORGANISM="Genus nov. species nov., Strain RCC1024" /LENGTH=358 /DNA_ID=CAMNT_0007292241 /DNA_START=367 /DNA_END=1439 /DNA_ORIENTATION=-
MTRAALLISAAAALQPAPPKRLFISGLGFVGLKTAVQFHDSFPDCAVAGCVRSEEKAAALRARYPWLEPSVFDLNENYSGLDAAGVRALASSSHIIQTVAPIADGDADPLLALHGDFVPADAWIAYLSSTGVYGDHDGEWIDEGAELRCVDAKSVARLGAEAAYGERGANVLRLGGIYGKGRSLLDAARRGSAGGGGGGKPVNRILADDIAGFCVELAKRDVRGEVFNVVDDDPAPRGVAGAFARGLLGVTDADTAAPARATRFTGSKRCRNAKMRELYKLSAPTYREGLAALHLADVEAAEEAARAAGAAAAAARRAARIASAQSDLQAVAFADQRQEEEAGETYWMKAKYQELQRL